MYFCNPDRIFLPITVYYQMFWQNSATLQNKKTSQWKVKKSNNRQTPSWQEFKQRSKRTNKNGPILGNLRLVENRALFAPFQWQKFANLSRALDRQITKMTKKKACGVQIGLECKQTTQKWHKTEVWLWRFPASIFANDEKTIWIGPILYLRFDTLLSF